MIFSQILAVVWDVKPEIVDLGFIAPRWYGLLWALCFIIGYKLMEGFFKKEKIKVELVDTLATYMLIATVVGARFGHVFFYQSDYYLAHPLDILKIWEGGLASHGAAIGILLGLYIFARREKYPYLWIVDRIVIVVALSGFLIRMGNLMNSEIYGHITDMPWGFVFVRDGQTEPRHPTQLYEALSYLLIFFYLLRHYYKKAGKTKEGYLTGVFMLSVFGMRFLIEFIKEAQVSFEESMQLNMGQWLSIPLILCGIYLIVRSRKQV